MQLLNKQPSEDRRLKSSIIAGKFFRMPEFERAKTILFYASFGGEVETFDMIRQAQLLGKRIALPRIHPQNTIKPVLISDLDCDLETGPYGIRQPHASNDRTILPGELDMVVVPGVAFDRFNNRLGRGGGYYDRFLGTLSDKVITVGLAFDFQIVDGFPPSASHDKPVFCVLSN